MYEKQSIYIVGFSILQHSRTKKEHVNPEINLYYEFNSVVM